MSFSRNTVQRLLSELRPLTFGLLVAGIVFGGGYYVSQRLYKPQEAAVDLAQYSSERYKLSVKYPAGWKSRESTEEEGTKFVLFSRPSAADGSDMEQRFTGQLLVDVFETAEGQEDIDEEAFFARINSNIDTTLVGKPEGSEDNEEYSELITKSDITIDSHRALRADVAITNYDGFAGEKGNGTVVFVFAGPRKQVTLLFESHSSDQANLKKVDEILGSFKLL
jgi:hypothetical protein